MRPASAAEVEPLAALGRAAWWQSIAPLVPASAQRVFRDTDPFTSFLRDAVGWVRVATIADMPVGFAAREADDGHVSDLWVAPAWQGRGVGTALLVAMERLVQATDAAEVSLEALHANRRACRFYERRGYTAIWRGVVHDPILGVALDRVRLVKRIRTVTSSGGG